MFYVRFPGVLPFLFPGLFSHAQLRFSFAGMEMYLEGGSFIVDAVRGLEMYCGAAKALFEQRRTRQLGVVRSMSLPPSCDSCDAVGQPAGRHCCSAFPEHGHGVFEKQATRWLDATEFRITLSEKACSPRKA